MSNTEKQTMGAGLSPASFDHGLPPPYVPETLESAPPPPEDGATAPPASSAPPTYEDVSAAGPRTNLASSDPPTLLLDGYIVHAASQPDRPLYELGLAPMTGRAGVVGMEKIWYSVRGEGRPPRQRKRFIYDIVIYPPLDHMFGHVDITGRAGADRTYSKMKLVGGAGWSSCKADGHFKARQTSWGQRLFHRGGTGNPDAGSSSSTTTTTEDKMVQVEWKDMDGRVVAYEEFPNKPKDGSEPTEQAKLRVQVPLEDKELDALVACWLGRLWRIRRSQTKEPLSWALIKRRIGSSPVKGGGMYSMSTNR